VLFLAAAPVRARSVEVAVDTSETHQTIEGLGAFCHTAPHEAHPDYYDMLVFDLGASMVRAGVQYNMEPVNDDADPNHINWAAFDLRDMVHSMETLHEFQKRGVTRFTASLWSPPEFMKTQRAIIQGGKLRPDMRQEYAEYMTAYLKAARDLWGVDFISVSLQNELLFLEYYMSCIYNPAQIREAVRATMRKFQREGIRTRIMMPEDMMFPDRMIWYVKPTMADPETRNFPGWFCTHRKGDFSDWRKFWNFVKPFDRQVWMTETGGTARDWGAAVAKAQAIYDALVGGNVSAWLFWDFNHIIDGNQPRPGYWPAKHYYRFIRPGALRVGADSSDEDLLVSAYKHPESARLTVVLVNMADSNADVDMQVRDRLSPTRYRLYLSDRTRKWLRKDEEGGPALSFTMPANSLVTVQSGLEDDLRETLAPNAIANPKKPAGIEAPPRHEWAHICRGAELGILDWVRNDLRSGTSVDARNPNGWTALHRATLWGRDNQWPMIQLLLENGADVNASANDGWTPVHMAAATYVKDPVRILKLFIQRGGDVHARTSDGWTPLHAAVANAWTGYKYDPNWSPERVRVLLEAGADVHAADINRRTPLHWAAWVGFTDRPGVSSEIVDILLEAGAKVDARDNVGRTPLHYACNEGYATIVQSLVEAGADANAPDDEGLTPADIAATREFEQILAILKGEGAAAATPEPKAEEQAPRNPVIGTGRFGAELRQAAGAGNLAAVRDLLARGADPDAADVNRRKTPLHLAAQAGHVEVVKALIAAGADTDALDSDGLTPAEKARDQGHSEIVKALKAAVD